VLRDWPIQQQIALWLLHPQQEDFEGNQKNKRLTCNRVYPHIFILLESFSVEGPV
jgi:hypothetical protein